MRFEAYYMCVCVCVWGGGGSASDPQPSDDEGFSDTDPPNVGVELPELRTCTCE